MYRCLRGVILIFPALLLLGACHSVPEHARYIPKNAVAVVGVNFTSLSKKIAWGVITGSKIFKEMQARMPEKNAKDAVSGIEKAGLDFNNTFYAYTKTDNRFKGGNKITLLAPLTDAGQWEAYIKTAVPGLQITQHGDRKNASLGNNMYVGWNNKLLIIINGLSEVAGSNDLALAEMDIAFGITKENSVVGNTHFIDLEKNGHDITFWLNYEQLMNELSGSIAEKMSMSLSGALWKDAAMATGFDFEKGKISGEMHYYLSPEMKDFGEAFGGANADNDMISRLPSRNMDMVAAMHLSPKALKIMLEKLNMLGIANLGLGIYGLGTDNVFDAFTGDMAFVTNDFSLKAETVVDSFMGQAIVRKNTKPSFAMSFIMKINHKEDFQKLMKIVKDAGLQPIKNGYVIPLTEKDSVYILINDQYAVASNKLPDATGFLDGSNKSQKMPEAVSSRISGHPWSVYIDVQEFCRNIDAGLSRSPQDSVMVSESKKLLHSISLTGGAFRHNAFEYHLDINFVNTDENSILELLNYAMKLNDASKTNAL